MTVRLLVYGIVQGVGFRRLSWRLLKNGICAELSVIQAVLFV